jgi:hypothetical protein
VGAQSVEALVTTIRDEVRRLLPLGSRQVPKGSRPGSRGRYSACPPWPPDLFAVAASLVSQSQCFTSPNYNAGWTKGYRLNDDYVDDVIGIGKLWRDMHDMTGVPTGVPDELAALWKRLMALGDCEIDKESRQSPWTELAMRLMAIADEAASGIGFGVKTPFAQFLLKQHLVYLKDRHKLLLPNIPLSLCMMVPLDEASVQPKSNTPQLGCTMRSLSHNLALLPRERSVAISWLMPIVAQEDAGDKPFNVLLVPFPYALNGTDFVCNRNGTPSSANASMDYFTVNQSWLRHGSRSVSARSIANFLADLITSARREVAEVHAVILPEAALDVVRADRVAEIIAKQYPELEIFITGAISTKEREPRNYACTYRLHKGSVLTPFKQSKHHRWSLENSQICRYQLGHVLDPGATWWEQIDVEGRAVAFSLVREGASLAVLVCEDLARYDPVMPALLSVGPNLVVALLMDGPQMESRWPGRYATVLAEDPGSSVLTLTCLGMVDRSSLPGDIARREIALWKQRGSDAKALSLPRGDHALLLSLTMAPETQFALDRRSDRGASRRFQLSAIRGVRLRQAHPWLELD